MQMLLYDEEHIIETDIQIKLYSDGTVTRNLPPKSESSLLKYLTWKDESI
jgi:hypothetical protein